ncbi:MAG: hypothetical protein IJX26_01130 [Clostridia bacterium]|nr:hypothetical protein [Clostridia bacterium]
MTFQELLQKIVDLQEEGLELFNIGQSTLGKNILATHVGSFDGTQIIIQGGIHAREYISTLLMIEQARYLHATGQVTDGGIYFIFLTNPDGAEIVLDGINNLPCEITKQYLTLANGSDDFSQYKANINLVDLNTNFDADWGTGSQNTFCPNTENFIGFYPNSEREVNNLINFTQRIKPSLTISYHSKGEVIYYGFRGQSQEDLVRDQAIGEQLSELTGYPLIFTENSSGGYKDWCIRYLQIPSYTIEIGSVDLDHPIGEENLPEIFQQNKDVPLVALNLAILYQNEINVASFKPNKVEKQSTKQSRFYKCLKKLLD